MKFYITRILRNSLLLSALCLFFIGCSYSQSNLKQSITKELSSFEEIKEYITKDSLVKSNTFIYSDSLKSQSISKKIGYLKSKGLLGVFSGRLSAPIFYGGKNCLIFFLKTEKKATVVYEHLLVYNNDEGRELGCVSTLYSVNTLEEVNQMDVSLFKMDGSMTYVIIKHDQVTGL